ncbi:hypothetical protein [Acinetobacter baumannii]
MMDFQQRANFHICKHTNFCIDLNMVVGLTVWTDAGKRKGITALLKDGTKLYSQAISEELLAKAFAEIAEALKGSQGEDRPKHKGPPDSVLKKIGNAESVWIHKPTNTYYAANGDSLDYWCDVLGEWKRSGHTAFGSFFHELVSI